MAKKNGSHSYDESLIEAQGTLIEAMYDKLKELSVRLNDTKGPQGEILDDAPLPDVFELNIAGNTNISVSRRTLTCVENSMLAAKFSGRWDESLERDSKGRIFLDHDPALFLQILEFLRFKALGTVDNVPDPPEPSRGLDILLEYYELMSTFYPFEIRPFAGYKPDTRSHVNSVSEIRMEHPLVTVTTKENCSFDVTVEHGRLVKSTTFLVGPNTKEFVVAWRKASTFGFTSNRLNVYYPSVDFMRKMYFRGGTSQTCGCDLPTVSKEIQEGTEITMEQSLKEGTWSICAVDAQNTEIIPRTILPSGWRADSPMPCFSIHGTLTITSVKYVKVGLESRTTSTNPGIKK